MNLFKYISGLFGRVRAQGALLENFLSLFSLRTVNYILPLVTLPYLVRVLGPAKFGLIAFAQALVQYFIILIEYGFNYSATRELSVVRGDARAESAIFSGVLVIKAAFMIAGFLILAGLCYFVPKFRGDRLIYVFSYGMVAGNVLFPIWFFQGMEKMKYIAYLTLVAKVIFTISIFVFVKAPGDYILVPLVNSVGAVTAGIFSLWVVFRDFGVTLTAPGMAAVRRYLKDGLDVFASRVFISLYTTTNTFILGIFTGDAIVGYYAAAEKIIRVLAGMFEPVFQAAYPFISKTVARSREKAVGYLREIFLLVSAAAVPAAILIAVFSGVIASVALGPEFGRSAGIMRILAPLVLVVPAATVLANLGLLPFKLDRYFLRVYVSGGALNMALLVLFLYVLRLSAEGAALANLVTEVCITGVMWIVLRKNNIRVP